MESPYDTSQQSIEDNALVSWPRVAAVSAMVSFSIPTFMTGIELFSLLPWEKIAITLLIGGALLTLVGGLMGSIGAITRKNSYMLVKVAFGDQGARILNLLFAISLVGWFGLNLDLFSSSVAAILNYDAPNNTLTIGIEATVGMLMILTTMYGFNVINRLSIILVPLMLVVSGVLLYQSLTVTSFHHFTSAMSHAHGSISQGVSLIVGVIIIGAIILPDITRFSRQRRGGAYTAFWSYLIAQSAVIVIAGFAAFALKANNILDVLLALGIGSWSLLIVIAGSWILNALNLYSAELAVNASLPRLKQNLVAIGLGVVGMFAAFANILEIFVLFLSVLTAVFIPVAGIIAVDFFVLNKSGYSTAVSLKRITCTPPTSGQLSDKAIASEQYPTSVQSPLSSNHKSALIAWAVGAGIAGYDLFEPLSLISGIAALDAIVVSAILHLVVCSASRLFTDR
ncbi:cytosine permease [Alteromonas sp. KUL106]|uniref:purine-cytosine permease family protein n=1 Tax=Alteromonas sp. KUL106 TaxID=2480799 RepID=UPI0012E46134|nr:cytosine permease [Alteromonas sp. KUL106]GFD69508.1 cytosine permease [Alteromonas sp. KUL106]